MKYRFFAGVGIGDRQEEVIEVPDDEDVEEYFNGWLEQYLSCGWEKIKEVE